MAVLPAYQGGTLSTDSYYGQLTISDNTTALALTAAVDPTLNSNADYTQISGIFDAVPHGENNNVSQQANSFTILNDGVYEIKVWANVSSTLNNNRVALKFAIDGAIAVDRRPATTIETAGTFYNVAAYGYIQLSAGNVITLYNASDKTANITWQDMVFAVSELKRL